MLNTTKKKIPNEWRDIVYAFLERLSVVKTSVFSKLICLLLFSRFVLHAKSLQLCLTLWDPMDCSQASLSMGFSRQEYWSGWPCYPSRNLPDPGIEPAFLKSHALVGGFFTTSTTREALSLQLCPTLCSPMDCSPPGSSLHGISQARILEWVAVSFSRGSSWTWDRTDL